MNNKKQLFNITTYRLGAASNVFNAGSKRLFTGPRYVKAWFVFACMTFRMSCSTALAMEASRPSAKASFKSGYAAGMRVCGVLVL